MLLPVWDLDSKLLGTAAVARDEAVLAELLTGCGITAITVSSGPGGGRHLWTSCPRGVPATLMARLATAGRQLLPTLDVSLFTSPVAAARPPGSPHRDGGRARLDAESPGDIDEAIRVLKLGAPVAAFELLADRMEAAAAETRARAADCQPAPALVRDAEHDALVARRIRVDAAGHVVGLARPARLLPLPVLTALERTLEPDEDHSAHGYSVLVRLALAGATRTDVERYAASAPGLEFLRSERTEAAGGARRSLAEPERGEILARQWVKAVRFAASLPEPETRYEPEDDQRRLVNAAVALSLKRVDGAPRGRWGGGAVPSGPADLAVLLYALQVMLRTGRLEVELPCRSVARATGRHQDTAARALWRHDQDREFLELRAPAAGVHGARYALVPDLVDEARRLAEADPLRERPAATEPFAELHTRLTDDLAVLSADLFAHGTGGQGLGRHAAITFLALRRAWSTEHRTCTAAELAAATGLLPRSAERHLRALAKHELVALAVSRPPGWYPTGMAVGAVDQGRGEGRSRRLARDHAVQSVVWAWWQTELAWLRSPKPEKLAALRAGRRRHPYEQAAIAPPVPEWVAAQRYPRKARTVEHGRADLVPDHGEAARIVRLRLEAARDHDLGRHGPPVTAHAA